MPQDTALRRLGVASRSAAQRHGGTVGARERVCPCNFETHALLARLGLPADIRLDPDAPPLTTFDRDVALARLHTENRRLARLARVRHPGYDLNRHIAVRRLLTAIDRASQSAPATGRAQARRAARVSQAMATATQRDGVLLHEHP